MAEVRIRRVPFLSTAALLWSITARLTQPDCSQARRRQVHAVQRTRGNYFLGAAGGFLPLAREPRLSSQVRRDGIDDHWGIGRERPRARASDPEPPRMQRARAVEARALHTMIAVSAGADRPVYGPRKARARNAAIWPRSTESAGQ